MQFHSQTDQASKTSLYIYYQQTIDTDVILQSQIKVYVYSFFIFSYT